MAEKPKPRKEKEAKAKPEERILIIPLREKADKSAKNKRMNRSVREIKAFVARHMAAELADISISQQLNESLWKGGYHKPPAYVKVKASRDEEGKVRASMIEEKAEPKKEKKGKGIRERLSRRREGAEDKSAEKKEEKAEPKPAEGKKEARPEHKTEQKKEEAKPADEAVEQDILLEE